LSLRPELAFDGRSLRNPH